MRPEEQARRDAQAAAARGEQPEEQVQELNVPVLEQRTYNQFFVAGVESLPSGAKVVQFLTPTGVLHVWTLNEEAAKALGQQLLAPSVEIVGADAMPAAANGRPGGQG